MSPASSVYHRGRHCLAVVLAACTFVLVVAGATTDSMGAGLAVPDWPTSFGSFRMPPMVGGIKYEQIHRMIAGVAVLLTLALTAWVLQGDRRRWLRWVMLAALGTVIIQAILGGLTVLMHVTPWIVTSHATVGQSFLCLTVLAAVGTSRAWLNVAPPELADIGRPTLRRLTLLAAGAVFLQLILGAGFRNSAIGLLPHFLMAWVVCGVLIWMAVRILTHFAGLAALRRLAAVLMGLLVVQVGLGFSSYITKYAAGAPWWPRPLMVTVTVSHVSIGSLILVTCVLLAVLARQQTVAAEEAAAPAGMHAGAGAR